MTAGEIDERFQHTWPTTSRHLRVLEQAGLLVYQKQGRTRTYRVNAEKLNMVREWLAWFETSRQNNMSSDLSEKIKTTKKSRRVQ